LPTDGELMHRWTKGAGLTDPVLLGSSSFGRAGVIADEKLTARIQQVLLEPQPSPELQRVLDRLSNAPAIGTFYIRLAPGDDALRVDALASTFGRDDLRLLRFTRTLVLILRRYHSSSIFWASMVVSRFIMQLFM